MLSVETFQSGAAHLVKSGIIEYPCIIGILIINPPFSFAHPGFLVFDIHAANIMHKNVLCNTRYYKVINNILKHSSVRNEIAGHFNYLRINE